MDRVGGELVRDPAQFHRNGSGFTDDGFVELWGGRF